MWVARSFIGLLLCSVDVARLRGERSVHIWTFLEAGTLADSDNRMFGAPVDTSGKVSNAIPL
jgi:hypothetical protein